MLDAGPVALVVPVTAPDPATRETEPECTCTPPPHYEGPCAWCDVHGQPSVAFEQGVAEGRHNERIIAEIDNAALRAEVAALNAAADKRAAASVAVAAKWEQMGRCYQSTEESVQLAELLDRQASSVAALPDTTELEHARPVVQAAREYVERLRAGDWSYPGHETELLRALAARVAALPDTTETEES